MNIFTVIFKRNKAFCSNVGWAKYSVPNNSVPPPVGHVATAPLPNLQLKPTQNHPCRLGKARACPTIKLQRKSHTEGFSYVEVLVATMLMAIALVPAMNALQTGIQSTGIHQSLTVQHYQRLQKMEEINAEPFAKLLAAAKIAANKSTATTYSDASGTNNRRVVYIALYDADTDPFTLNDPNTDSDNDLYTGSTANLLWIRVETEGTAKGIETLVSR